LVIDGNTIASGVYAPGDALFTTYSANLVDSGGTLTIRTLEVDLNFEEDTSLVFVGTTSSGRRFYNIRNAYPDSPDKVHRLIQDAQPHPDHAVARIVDGIGVGGSRGLELAFPPSEMTAEYSNERMELYMVHGNSESTALNFGDIRYLAYALYIEPGMEPPAGHATITQCWQLPTDSKSFTSGAFRRLRTVPMWMTMKSVNGNVGYSLHVKNEGAPIDGEYLAGSVIAGTGEFQPGWNTLIFRFEPRHLNDPLAGRITFWLNSLDESQPTHDLAYNWGVTPQDELAEGLPDTGHIDRFDVRIGMYRQKQNQHLRLVYDNVRYGKKFGEVLPTNP
jgi:hypothetical protein